MHTVGIGRQLRLANDQALCQQTSSHIYLARALEGVLSAFSKAPGAWQT